MRSLTPLQRAGVITTAVLAVGGFAFGAGLARPDMTLTIERESAPAVTLTAEPGVRHTATNRPRPVSGDAPATPGPHKRSQRLTTIEEQETAQ